MACRAVAAATGPPSPVGFGATTSLALQFKDLGLTQDTSREADPLRMPAYSGVHAALPLRVLLRNRGRFALPIASALAHSQPNRMMRPQRRSDHGDVVD